MVSERPQQPLFAACAVRFIWSTLTLTSTYNTQLYISTERVSQSATGKVGLATSVVCLTALGLPRIWSSHRFSREEDSVIPSLQKVGFAARAHPAKVLLCGLE